MIRMTGPRRFVIAVIDDDYRVLQSLEELLASGSYGVCLFSSAVEFLNTNAAGKVDCLISDIAMPAMTGWQLLQTAETEFPDLPVILITGQDERPAPDLCNLSGLRYLFRKPFSGRELLAALDVILPSGSHCFESLRMSFGEFVTPGE